MHFREHFANVQQHFWRSRFSCFFKTFRSDNYDFPTVLTSDSTRQKFKFPAKSYIDAVAEVLKREALVVVQMTFDANEDSNVLKSAVVNVKPIRVYLEG